MGIKLSIGALVVIVLSVIMIIVGVFLLVKISAVKDVIPEYPVSEDIIVEVNPVSSQKGTVFLINAVYSKQREQQDLNLFVEKGDYSSLLNLYDDGNHHDKKANDGVYGGFFDSSNLDFGKYGVVSGGKVLNSFEISESKCESLYGFGDINFIMLPYGYEDYSEFKKQAKALITGKDSLLEIEPFKSNKDKFSFLTINVSQDLKCSVGCKNVSTIVCCDNVAVFEEASKCGTGSVLILINNKDFCGSASSYSKICAENKDSNLILVHEVGHSFGDLADEYVYSDYYGDYAIGEVDEINCAEEGCEKWKDIGGCYEGCTYSNLYRSVKDKSIMYDLYPEFNDVCEEHLSWLMNKYSSDKSNSDYEKGIPKSYFVKMKYNQGEIKVDSVFLKPISSGVDYRESDYEVKVKDKNEKEVFVSNLYIPDKLYPLPGTFGKLVYEDNFDFALSLPYSSEAENLVVYRDEEQIVSTSLSVFSDNCGNDVCDAEENHLNCAVDCDIKDGFCETSICDPDCESQEYCKLGNNFGYFLGFGFIIGFFVLIVIVIWRFRR